MTQTYGVQSVPLGALEGKIVPTWGGLQGMIDPTLDNLNRLIPIVEMDYQGGPTTDSAFKIQVMVGSPLNLGNSTTLQDAAFPQNGVNSQTITASLDIKKYMFSAQASMTADQFANAQNPAALQTGDIAQFLPGYILDDWTRHMTTLPFSRNQGCVAVVESVGSAGGLTTVTISETASILEMFINLGGQQASSYSGGPLVELGAELHFCDAGGTVQRGQAYLRSFDPNTRIMTLSSASTNPLGIAATDRIYYRNPFVASGTGFVNTRPYSVRDLADYANFPSLFGCNATTYVKFRPQNVAAFGAWNETRLYQVLNRIPAQNGGQLEGLDVCLHMDTMAKAKATLLNKVGRTAFSPGEMDKFNLNLPKSSILDYVGQTSVSWLENAMMPRGEFVGLGQFVDKKMAGIPIPANVKKFPTLPAARLQFPNLKQLSFVPKTPGAGDTEYRKESTLIVECDALAYLQHVTVGEGRRFLSLVQGVDYLNSFSD